MTGSKEKKGKEPCNKVHSAIPVQPCHQRLTCSPMVPSSLVRKKLNPAMLLQAHQNRRPIPFSCGNRCSDRLVIAFPTASSSSALLTAGSASTIARISARWSSESFLGRPGRGRVTQFTRSFSLRMVYLMPLSDSSGCTREIFRAPQPMEWSSQIRERSCGVISLPRSL